MQKFKHPHIIEIIEVEKNGKSRFDIIQEYCQLGSLENYIDDLDEQDISLTEK